MAFGAIPKNRSSKPPNVEWAHQTSSIINIDLVSEDVNACHKDVMVTGTTKRRAASALKGTYMCDIHIPANSPGFPGSLQVFHQISRSPD